MVFPHLSAQPIQFFFVRWSMMVVVVLHKSVYVCVCAMAFFALEQRPAPAKRFEKCVCALAVSLSVCLY